MTSEIRANTLKNRVGLGTVSFTNTGPVVSGIVTIANSTAAGVTLEDNAGVGNSLKITTPTGYVSIGSGNATFVHLNTDRGVFYFQRRIFVDEGIIGSYDENLILQSPSNINRIIINKDTGLVSIVNDLDVDGHTNLDHVSIAGITTFTNGFIDFKPGNGGNAHFRILSTGSGEAGIFFDAANGDIAGSDYVFIGQKNNLDFVINPNANAGNIDFQRAGTTQLRIDTSGRLGIGTDGPATKCHIYDASTDPYLRIGGGGRDCGIQLDANTNFTAFRADGANRLWINAGADGIYFTTGGTSTSNTRLKIDTSGNITQTGSSYLIDSAGSAEFILDRANTSSGATVSYKTGGTLKWYNGLRGLVNDDFYLRSEAANLDVLYIQTYGNIFHNCNSAGNPAGITIKNVNTNGYSHARLRLESQNNASYSNIYTDHPNTALRLEYNSSNSMYIKSDGKVGIREATPAYTLESVDSGHTRHSIICSDNNSAGIYGQVMNGSSLVGNFTSRVDGSGNYDLYTGTSTGMVAQRVKIADGYGNPGRITQINRQINLTGLDQNNLSDMLLARMIQAIDVARASGTSVVTNDSRTTTGIAIIRNTGSDNNTFFFGPYGYIEAGSYTAMFRMKTSVNTGSNPLVYLDVVGNGIANARGRGNQRPRVRTLYPTNFTNADQYQYFYLDFEVQNPPTGGSSNNYLETRALNHYPSRGHVSLDHILIVPRSVTYT